MTACYRLAKTCGGERLTKLPKPSPELRLRPSQKKGGWLALRTQTEFDCLAIEADQEMTACYRLAKTCG